MAQWLLMTFRELCRRVFAPQMAPHLRTGRHGEDIARRFLQRKRYRILARNVRIGKHDEIDLIAYDPTDRVIAFVEVKTRACDHPDFLPERDLTYGKRHRISRAARRWVADRRYQGGYRLDLVCVADGAVTEHYEDLEWA